MTINELSRFYSKYPYPHTKEYNVKKCELTLAPKNLDGGSILVAGCGTIEAVLVANSNPKSTVIGIDLSKPSIQIAKSIRRNARVKNLTLKCADLLSHTEEGKYDFVLMSGVLHHIKQDREAANKAYSLLKPGGVFAGMVYSDKRPSYIKTINSMFKQGNFTIDQVRSCIKDLPWYQTYSKATVEVADTWLHPYFKEYSPSTLSTVLGSFSSNYITYAGIDDTQLYFVSKK